MKNIINNFIANNCVAVAGVSRNKAKWGNILSAELTKLGYQVIPINPFATDINGVKCYNSVKSLPANITNLILAVSADTACLIINECEGSPIKNIWLTSGAFNKGSGSKDNVMLAKSKNINVVYGFCPMMFFSGKGMHKLHLNYRLFRNNIPKEY